MASRIRVELTALSSSSCPVTSLAALAETMIITDDHGMRAKFSQQEFFDIFLGCELGESFGEGNDDEVVDLLPGQQAYLLLEGIDQPDILGAALHDFAGVRKEGDDHGFAIDAGCFFPQLM